MPKFECPKVHELETKVTGSKINEHHDMQEMKDRELLESQAHVANSEMENLQAKKLAASYIGVLERQKANLSTQVQAIRFDKRVESQAWSQQASYKAKEFWARTFNLKLNYWPGHAQQQHRRPQRTAEGQFS